VTDPALGYLLLGLGIVAVLVIVFVVTAGVTRGPATHPSPPSGVHLPAPSLLPVAFSLGAALIGAGMAFRPQDQLFNWWLLVPGLIVFVGSAVAWVRAAGREWTETEHGGHGAGHAAQPPAASGSREELHGG
jgi:hypothetical protein